MPDDAGRGVVVSHDDRGGIMDRSRTVLPRTERSERFYTVIKSREKSSARDGGT